ncbi:hypothetical protein TWF718_004403 [Orbilia javanica]|uniref:Uncharacterized protein n=1 Tax=Orbilia javanica TaxID=47235 RepID=A0AAN8RKY9_9PEZI
MSPKKSILEVFPVEIIILIARYMPYGARDNFSRCSVLCYQLCFSLRFRPNITLTPDSISLFKDGGICEPVRRSIRSIRFLSPHFLDPKIRRQNHIVNFADFPDYSFEFFITQIRTFTSFVDLFPNIHELYIYYHVPLASEFNLYSAILKRICMTGSSTRNTLRRLEIQFHKNPAPNIDGPFGSILRGIVTAIYWLFSWDKSTASPAPVSYQDLYSALSSGNRAFLGKEIKEGDLKEFGPKLPSLRTATIWAHRPTNLLDEDNIGIFERSRFYSASLATAPKLDTLYVKNEVLRDFRDKVDVCQIVQLGEKLGVKFCDQVSLIEYLGVIHARPEIPDDQISLLFDTRSRPDPTYSLDLETSQMTTDHGSSARSLSDQSDSLNDIEFKKLGRSISPKQLKTVVDGLAGIKPGRLPTPIIEVEGVRFQQEGYYGLFRTFLSTQRTGKGGRGGLKVKGSAAPAPYVGSQRRYTDPDYIENPAAYICRVVIIYGLIVVLSKVVSIRLETYMMV